MTAPDQTSALADVAIVGAGPAGAASAQQCALRGLRTVLIDRYRFPRPKVCGCCLSAAACGVLDEAGLSGALNGAIAQRRVVLRCGRWSAEAPASGGMILSRTAFDAALVRAAERTGAEILESATAIDVDLREDRVNIRVRQNGGEFDIAARVLIAADGLGGRLLDGVLGRRIRKRCGSIGIGAVMAAETCEIDLGVVELGIGRGGYVGVARLENGEVGVAASLDPRRVRALGGAREAIHSIVAESGLDLAIPGDVAWKGTPTLTSRRSLVAGWRVLVVGDSAGYLEPITGEGIGWALASGVRAAAIVERGGRRWDDALAQEWAMAHRSLVRKRRGLCAIAAAATRRPALGRLAVGTLSRSPAALQALAGLTARQFALDRVVRA